MVATKKSSLQEGNFDVRRGGGSSSSSVTDSATETRLSLPASLGGFIFICNNDTMDLERCLFEGLPQRYQDVVRAITPGMPLFLYNYSTRKLYGVYEAASNGGLNIDPDAWAESKDTVRNGKPVSKYPSQVRVRLREKRPPLEEDKFRPFLRHYEYPKFKLDLNPEEVTIELSKKEVDNLLKLFGMDESGWQTVRGNKPNRSHHVPAIPQTLRRRPAPVANGTGANGCPALTGLGNPANDGVTRPGSRADTAHRWRTDSDSWSGSSSAGTVSSSWTSIEEDRPKKSCIANGALADAIGSGFGEEKVPEGRVKRMEHVNGSSETDRDAEAGISSGDATYSNGVHDNALSNSAARGSSSKPGFASYSAAVSYSEAVMARSRSPTSVQTSGCEPPAGSSTNNDAGPSASAGRTDSGKATATSSLLADASPLENMADKKQKSTGNGAIRSPKADSQSVWVAHSKQKADNVPSKGGRSEEQMSGQQTGTGSADDKASCTEVEKKPDRVQPWSKPVASAKPAVNDSGNGNGAAGGIVDSQRPASIESSDLPVAHEVHQTEDVRGDVANIEEMDLETCHGKETNRKTAWQGNDAAVLRRIQDPDPAGCSSMMNGGSADLKPKSEPAGKCMTVQGGEVENEHILPVEVMSQKQQGQLSEQLGTPTPSHGLKVQTHFLHSRPTHEARRPQFEYQKHERHLEDRPGHYRKQQLPVDHAQNPPMTHARQHGHNLPPIRVPTSPPPPLQQLLHHPLPASTTPAAPIYRERPHNRSIRAGNGSGEGGQVTYRPVATRTGLDGDMGLPSPISPGPVAASAVPPSPVPPSPASLWTFPTPIAVSPSFLPGYPTFFLQQPIPAYGFHPNVDILHTEILEYARSATPTPEARRRAEAAVECVRKGVKQLWGEADVEVFGSFATGLCLCHSDVDVVVVDTPPPSVYEQDACAQGGARALAPLVRNLAAALGPLDWCESIMTIERATMPVVKLRCMPDGKTGDTSTPVAIDITIGGRARASGRVNDPLSGKTPLERSNHLKFEAARNYHNGLPTREYVIERLRTLPALAPLVLLLKSYLHKRGLNDVYSGGLGSFSLTLMLVFYLERAPPVCAMWLDLPPGRSLGSTNASVDTHSASSCDEVDEADDNTSTSSYCSTNTSASSSSNEGTAMSGESNSATSSLTMEGRANSMLNGEILQGSPGGTQVRRAGGILEELLSSMQTVPAPTLGVLLLGFLRMFESTDFSSVQFVLKGNNGTPGGIFPVNGNGRHYHLWIDDPLRPGSNIGAGSFNMRAVQSAMGDMLKILTQPPTPSLNGSERAGIGPGRRRLLDPLFAESGPSS